MEVLMLKFFFLMGVIGVGAVYNAHVLWEGWQFTWYGGVLTIVAWAVAATAVASEWGLLSLRSAYSTFLAIIAAALIQSYLVVPGIAASEGTPNLQSAINGVCLSSVGVCILLAVFLERSRA